MTETLIIPQTIVQTVSVPNGGTVTILDQRVDVITAGSQGPAGPGVATGGTAGQVLKKNSSANYDTAWMSLGALAAKNSAGLASADVSGILPISSGGTAASDGQGAYLNITGSLDYVVPEDYFSAYLPYIDVNFNTPYFISLEDLLGAITNSFLASSLSAVGLRRNYRSVSADYTLLISTISTSGNDCMLDVNATGGARVITLPAAITCPGYMYIITKTDTSANSVTVDGNGSETINGAANVVLTAQWSSVSVYSTGAVWRIASKYL